MKGIRQFHSLFFFLALFSLTAGAQTVSSVSITPDQNNTNTLLTANVQGTLPNPCYTINSTVSVTGNYINIYLEFMAQPGSCAQVVTPFTQNIIIGTLPAGTYTVRVYNTSTGEQIFPDQQFTVSSGCQAPTLSQLFASNITFTSIRINCSPISGVVYYQFIYRPVGFGYWYSAPASGNNYWNMTGLTSNSNYEYRCRVYCNGAWTAYSASQYCSTQNQTSGSNCNNAIILACGVTYSGSNNTGSYNYSNYLFPNGAQFTNMTGSEAYHRFTVTSTSNVTITLSGLSQNLHLFLLNNCNTNCNTTNGMGYSCNTGNNSEQLTMNNLAPGTYTVIVDGWQGAHCNYNLTVQCTVVAICNAPTSSQVFTSNVTSTSVRLNTSASGNHYDWAYRAPGGNWVNLPSTTTNYTDITGLQPGVTYQFIAAVRCYNNVWSYWSPICYCTTTSSNNPGSSCGNAIIVNCGNAYWGNNGTGSYNYTNYYFNGQSATETGPEVVYKITVAANTSLSVNLSNLSGDLDLFLLSSCNATPAVIGQSGHGGSTSESLTVNNLPAGTYYIVVDGWNGCISNYLLTVICNGGNVCPANDDPCGSVILYSNTTCVNTTGTNAGATTTTNPGAAPGCNYTGMKDVWYAVKIPSTGKMRVTTGAGTLTNGLIGIYGGSYCSYLSCYGCVDNTSGSLMPQVTISGSPGTWIYLRIWGYNGSVGTFTICVTTLNNGGSALMDNSEDAVFAIDADDRSADQETGLNALAEQFSLKVFPVPTQDEINFSAQLPTDKAVEIRIFDLNGRLVKEMNGLQSGNGNLLQRMEVGELPTGLYIVKVRAGETELTGKFSKI